MVRHPKRHPLPPLLPGYSDYWVLVEVQLHEPLPVEDEDNGAPVVGYMRNFGVRAKEGAVRALLEGIIDDGTIRWETTEYSPVDPRGLDRIVQQRMVTVDPQGIWYRGGRVFYPDEPEPGVGPVQ